MNFATKTYKTQSIVYCIMMILSFILAAVSIIGIVISLLNSNNNEANGLGNAFLLVFSIIGVIVGAVLGIFMLIKFIASLRLYRGLKNSMQEFMLKKASRVVDLIFGVIVILAGIICVFMVENLALKIAAAVIAVIVLIFLVLDIVALKKVKAELGSDTENKKEIVEE